MKRIATLLLSLYFALLVFAQAPSPRQSANIQITALREQAFSVRAVIESLQRGDEKASAAKLESVRLYCDSLFNVIDAIRIALKSGTDATWEADKPQLKKALDGIVLKSLIEEPLASAPKSAQAVVGKLNAAIVKLRTSL